VKLTFELEVSDADWSRVRGGWPDALAKAHLQAALDDFVADELDAWGDDEADEDYAVGPREDDEYPDDEPYPGDLREDPGETPIKYEDPKEDK